MVQPVKVKVHHNDSLERAKAVPITSLYRGELKPSAKAVMGLCPFHEDSIRSFAIYKETNTWWCFTEDIGGSVIDFYMKLKDVDFKTAIQELRRL